ncbi:uncharacterized protein [Narcine bancroftii]|uniref:uncharacterized protein n=1 Tax=Narcine bancroftii TaxID=1343680 RepID=UPI0038317A68
MANANTSLSLSLSEQRPTNLLRLHSPQTHTSNGQPSRFGEPYCPDQSSWLPETRRDHGNKAAFQCKTGFRASVRERLAPLTNVLPGEDRRAAPPSQRSAAGGGSGGRGGARAGGAGLGREGRGSGGRGGARAGGAGLGREGRGSGGRGGARAGGAGPGRGGPALHEAGSLLTRSSTVPSVAREQRLLQERRGPREMLGRTPASPCCINVRADLLNCSPKNVSHCTRYNVTDQLKLKHKTTKSPAFLSNQHQATPKQRSSTAGRSSTPSKALFGLIIFPVRGYVCEGMLPLGTAQLKENVLRDTQAQCSQTRNFVGKDSR